MRSFILHGKGGVKLYSRVWDDVKENSNIVVQIVHGMNEHAGRYDEIARYFNEKGIIVYAHDHRGHGKTIVTREEFGDFEDNSGWENTVEDIYEMNKYIKTQYSDKKVIIYGHSLGSFLTRSYIASHGDSVDGVILSGTSFERTVMYKFSKLLVCIETMRKGPRKRSKFINMLIFGRFNNKFKPNRTAFDWLSSDDKEVDAFKNDPLRGGMYTNKFYKNFFNGLQELSGSNKIELVPRDIPYLLISGKDDPMSKDGKAIRKLEQVYLDNKISNVSVIIYDGMRHEIHKERERNIVFNDISKWIEKNYR